MLTRKTTCHASSRPRSRQAREPHCLAEPLEPRLFLSAVPVIDYVKINGAPVNDFGGSETVYIPDLEYGFTFELAVANSGPDASPALFNSLTVSFESFTAWSDLDRVSSQSQSSDLNYTEYLYNLNGDGDVVNLGGDGFADYVMVESQDTDGWQIGEVNYLKVHVRPHYFGNFNVHYRTAMSDADNWDNTIHVPDRYGSNRDCLNFGSFLFRLDIQQDVADMRAEILVEPESGQWGDTFSAHLYVSNETELYTDGITFHLVMSNNDILGDEDDIPIEDWPPMAFGPFDEWSENYDLEMPPSPPVGYPANGDIWIHFYVDELPDEPRTWDNYDDERLTMSLPPSVLVVQDTIPDPDDPNSTIFFTEFLDTSAAPYLVVSESDIMNDPSILDDMGAVVLTNASLARLPSSLTNPHNLMIYEPSTTPIVLTDADIAYDPSLNRLEIPALPPNLITQPVPVPYYFDSAGVYSNFGDPLLLAGILDPTHTITLVTAARDYANGEYVWGTIGLVAGYVGGAAKHTFITSLPACLATIGGFGGTCYVTGAAAVTWALSMVPSLLRGTAEPVAQIATRDHNLLLNVQTGALQYADGTVDCNTYWAPDIEAGHAVLRSDAPSICSYITPLSASRGYFELDDTALYNKGWISHPSDSSIYEESVDYAVYVDGGIHIDVVDDSFDYYGPWEEYHFDFAPSPTGDDIVWSEWLYPVVPLNVDFALADTGELSAIAIEQINYDDSVPIGEEVSIEVLVGIETGVGGVVQLTVQGDMGTYVDSWDIVAGNQSTERLLSVVVVQLTEITEIYNTYVQFRPYAENGPLNTSNIEDVVESIEPFAIAWRADDIYDNGDGNDDFDHAAELTPPQVNLELRSLDDDYFQVYLTSGSVLTSFVAEGLSHRLYYPDRVRYETSDGSGGQSAQITADDEGWYYIYIPDGDPDVYRLTIDVESPPSIGTLMHYPEPVRQGRIVTLVAEDVTDPNGPDDIEWVEFYWDSNESGAWDNADSVLGRDDDGRDGWSLRVPAAWPVGSVLVAARAYDGGLWSDPAEAWVTVVSVGGSSGSGGHVEAEFIIPIPPPLPRPMPDPDRSLFDSELWIEWHQPRWDIGGSSSLTESGQGRPTSPRRSDRLSEGVSYSVSVQPVLALGGNWWVVNGPEGAVVDWL